MSGAIYGGESLAKKAARGWLWSIIGKRRLDGRALTLCGPSANDARCMRALGFSGEIVAVDINQDYVAACQALPYARVILGDAHDVARDLAPFDIMHLDYCAQMNEASVAAMLDTAISGAKPSGSIVCSGFSYGRESRSRMSAIEAAQDAADRLVAKGAMVAVDVEYDENASGKRIMRKTSGCGVIQLDTTRTGRTMAFREIATRLAKHRGWGFRLHRAIFYVARRDGRQTPMVYFIGDLKKGPPGNNEHLTITHITGVAARIYDAMTMTAKKVGSARASELFCVSTGHVAAKLAHRTMSKTVPGSTWGRWERELARTVNPFDTLIDHTTVCRMYGVNTRHGFRHMLRGGFSTTRRPRKPPPAERW